MNFNRQGIVRVEQEGSTDSINLTDLVEHITGFVRRQFPIFVFIMACSLAIGLVYLFTTPPNFTAHAMLLIDSSKVRMLQQQQSPIGGDVPIDTAHVETQLEILKSESIALSVIKDLKLTADVEFVRGQGFFGKMFAFLSPSTSRSETQLAREALEAFERRRSIGRVGRTYVLDIGFTSTSPENAAKIANSIADAYIVDQLEAKYQATRRASGWLQDRIKELRQQASDADRAVLNYKEKNNIISLGTNTAPNGSTTGKLLGEQQLEELNTQLGSARASAEEAKARLDRINEVMTKDVPDATVADSLHNEVINRLRNNYLDIAAKEAIWSARYGSGHLAAVNLRTQMTELRRSILDELKRIQQGYESDYQIAKTRVEGLERSLEGLVANSQVVNRDRLGLRDLESTAQVYHTIYDNFLQRYMEAIQQQSFPITEARVISVAAEPRKKSGPISYVVIAMAGIVGLVLSFVAALMREAVDQVFRTTRQVESALQSHCIAVLPLLGARIKQAGGKPMKSVVLRPAASSQNATVETEPLADGLAALAPDAVGTLTPTIARAISRKKAFANEVLDEPLSAFTEAFRGIKVAADISGKGNKVIGITSTMPAEGKSTVASNFAQLIAHSGNRVILIDGDLRNPSATRALAPDSKVGLIEVINGKASLEDTLYTDELTGLRFLPAVTGGRLLHTNEILASASLHNLIESLRKTYDYVIVDFPPLAPVVDVRATTQIVDSYLYVVEWGKTRVNLVKDSLLGCPEIHDRLLGIVLNKANVNVLERYESYYGKYYYRRHYGDRYGYSESA